LVKVEIEISPADLDFLTEVAKRIGCAVETLLKQEVSEALSNGAAWFERGSML
jgi:hypothetical protein